jgi:predicted metal-binding membrane protein
MTDLARVRNPVLLVSALAWILLLSAPSGIMTHCSMLSAGAAPSFRMVVAMNPPGPLAAGWLLMLTAMMLPILTPALWHIRASSFTHRRARASALFLAGYGAVWMVAGIVLSACGLAAILLSRQPYTAAAAVLPIAAVWQFSPARQRCLNRCHAHREIAAFGAAADLDAVRFGVTHGGWCAGSCWALMLLPMLLPRGHAIAMAAVAILIFGERLEQPSSPCWRVRGLGRLQRMVIFHARMRLKAL